MTYNKSIWLFAISLVFASGCSDSEPTGDTGSLPSEETSKPNINELVANVVKLRNTIRDGFTDGDIDAAHDPLHEIGFALKELPEAAKASGLPQEKAEAVAASVRDLMDAFGEVDKTLHGKEGSLYEDESERIDEGISALLKAVAEN